MSLKNAYRRQIIEELLESSLKFLDNARSEIFGTGFSFLQGTIESLSPSNLSNNENKIRYTIIGRIENHRCNLSKEAK